MKKESTRDQTSTKRVINDAGKDARRTNHSTSRQKQRDKITDLHHLNKPVTSATSRVKKSKGPTSHEAGDSYQTTERLRDQHRGNVQVTDEKSHKKDISNRIQEIKDNSRGKIKQIQYRENHEKTKVDNNDDIDEYKTDATIKQKLKFNPQKETPIDQKGSSSSKKSKSHNELHTSFVPDSKTQKPLDRDLQEKVLNPENLNYKRGSIRDYREENQYDKGDNKSRSNVTEILDDHLDSSVVNERSSLMQDIPNELYKDTPQTSKPDTTEAVDKYEDDFEDYASDFDDTASDSNSTPSFTVNRSSNKSQNIHTRINSEFSRNREKSVNGELYDTSVSPLDSKNVHIIDFNRSINTYKRCIDQRLKRRAADLMRLIELELDNLVLAFDMRPLDEYSNYIVRFGQANRSQAHIQTQDDALDREIQTDPIEFCPDGGVWTQWPPLDNGECSGKLEPSGWSNLHHLASGTLPEDTSTHTYLNELVKDFSCVSSSNSPVSVCKYEGTPLPSSLLPKLRMIVKIISEESIPKLFESACDPAFDSTERNFTQHLFCSDDSNPETVEAQTSIHGNSGCVACAFAPGNGDTLLTIHRPATISALNPLNDRTGFVLPAGEIIYVWSISGGSGAPKHQLYCPGLSEAGFGGANITRAIFSPDLDASMVIGGLADGSLCVWDLRATNHDCGKSRYSVPTPTGSDLSLLTSFKAPIYSTSGVEVQHVSGQPIGKKVKSFPETDFLSDARRHAEMQLRGKQQQQKQRHSVPIVEVQLTHSARDKSTLSNFQFAVLDNAGELSLWMIVRPNKSRVRNIYEILAGSQTDLGLRPQEHIIQMVCLAYMTPLLQIPREITEPTECFHTLSTSTSNDGGVENANSDTNWLLRLRSNPKVNATALSITVGGDFLVGFSDGTLIKHGRSPSQVVYPRQFAKPPSKAAVLCLATHPCHEFEVFLVGYADGLVRLYHFNHPDSLHEWNLSERRTHLMSTVKLLWSCTRPAVFFGLDSSGRVSSWDLLKFLPQYRGSRESENEQGADLSVSDNSADGFEIHVASAASDQNRIYDFALSSGVVVSSNGRTQLLSAFALIYPDAVKIHWLDTQWSYAATKEFGTCREMFQQLITGYG